MENETKPNRLSTIAFGVACTLFTIGFVQSCDCDRTPTPEPPPIQYQERPTQPQDERHTYNPITQLYTEPTTR